MVLNCNTEALIMNRDLKYVCGRGGCLLVLFLSTASSAASGGEKP